MAPSSPVASAASQPCSMWPEAERDAVGGDPEAGAAQVLLEAVHDEAALHFLAHAAGDHDDDREDDRVTPGLNHRLERVERHVVEARREGQHQADTTITARNTTGTSMMPIRLSRSTLRGRRAGRRGPPRPAP